MVARHLNSQMESEILKLAILPETTLVDKKKNMTHHYSPKKRK